MDTIKDGGPAFPFAGDAPLLCVDENGNPTGKTLGTAPVFQSGMTLRDWFAGKAPEIPMWFERLQPTSKLGQIYDPDMPGYVKWVMLQTGPEKRTRNTISGGAGIMPTP